MNKSTIRSKKKTPIDGPRLRITCWGDKIYYLNDQWHRDENEGPAKDWITGKKEWYLNGKRHRENGPAYIRPDGYQAWYFKGKLIKTKWSDESEYWYQNGIFHRDENDGPAIIEKSIGPGINQYWYQFGKLHRVNGPALLDANGDQSWYYEGVLHRRGGPAQISNHEGHEYLFWYQNGKLHREDGPAVIYEYEAREEWYLNGLRHRIGGPAYNHLNGFTECWYVNGELHREDGPAAKGRPDNQECWYYRGKKWLDGQGFIAASKVGLAMIQLELPAYVMQWILEYVEPATLKMSQVKLINLLQGLRESYRKIKKTRV